jgi:hypothetical protein
MSRSGANIEVFRNFSRSANAFIVVRLKEIQLYSVIDLTAVYFNDVLLFVVS